MLNENIKALRKSKGLSQEELAVKLNVVRQAVSKWERGLSVPDADLLIALSEATETPVSELLGESAPAPKADGLEALGAKLEVVNLQLARQSEARRRVIRGVLAAACAAPTWAGISTTRRRRSPLPPSMRSSGRSSGLRRSCSRALQWDCS